MGRTGFVLALAFCLPLLAGCATKGYVNDRVGELGTRLDEENAGLRGDLSRHGRTAGDALARADKAASMALGRVDYAVVDEYTLTFAFDSAELDDQAVGTLDNILQSVQSHPDYAVEILGHADTTGPDGYNDMLSGRRAATVLRYLVRNGPGPVGRYATVGFGESSPVYAGSREDKAASRRVVVSLLEKREPGAGGAEPDSTPVISSVDRDWER